MRTHANSVPIVLASVCLGLGLPLKAGRAETVWFYGGPFDRAIPADADATKGWMADATIGVPDHLIIADLDISVSLTHTSVFDLQLSVTSPSGTTVVLNAYDPFTDYFEGEDYRETVFDDEAGVSIAEAAAPFTGRFTTRVPGALSAFDGQDAFGDWRLEIYDACYGDRGCLDAFGLTITTPEPATAVILLLALGLAGLSARRRA